MKKRIFTLVLFTWVYTVSASAAETVNVGLNYPMSGPYAVQGLDQRRAASMAVEEINAAGGVMGSKIKIVWRDSQSRADLARKNVAELINDEGVKMVFGGSVSSVAVAAGEVCQDQKTLFFGTLTYSTATTGEQGHRHTFRECCNAWMSAKVISDFLKRTYPGKKYAYITADYSWGHTTEASMRKFTDTADTSRHKGMMTPFPGATERDFKKAAAWAKMVDPDVLVLVQFGKDMSTAIQMATAMGLKDEMQIVVPNLTLGMAEGGGGQAMEGVIGALPWCWQVPYQYDYPRGRKFVEEFASRYERYPSTSGASAYTILHQWKEAVERAGSFDSAAVIKALEGHEYELLKDRQRWRDFDHQSVQTVYAVKCKQNAQWLTDKYKLDCFDILSSLPGQEAVRTEAQWKAVRTAAGKPPKLEALPDE